MQSIEPATGEPLREYPEPDAIEVERRLAAAAAAAVAWRAAGVERRSSLLRAAARVLRERAPQLATLAVREMGKPIAAAEAEVEKCAHACDWFAAEAPRLLAPEPAATDAARSYVRWDPLGVVLAIMPWNFPFWQAVRCAAPALAAGNVVVLKHASNVPGCALALEEIFSAAGFPPGVFTTLLVPAAAVSGLIAHPVIAAVSLTGSEEAGVAVARAAGEALKKVVLELGGSDPFLVLADADPEAVAREAVAARTINNGQSCIAAKRLIVEAPLAPRFEAAVVERMRSLAVGDPLDRSVQIGPLARADLVATLHDQVERSVAAGATLACGGRPLERRGFFYAPTVLTRVTPGMPAFDEETFGPVAAIVRARDAADAVALANRSRFGLGASIWSRNPVRAEALVPAIEAGSVFVNGQVRSDPRLPFGGIKRSGHGRELAAFGIREFVNVKTVWVA